MTYGALFLAAGCLIPSPLLLAQGILFQLAPDDDAYPQTNMLGTGLPGNRRPSLVSSTFFGQKSPHFLVNWIGAFLPSSR